MYGLHSSLSAGIAIVFMVTEARKQKMCGGAQRRHPNLHGTCRESLLSGDSVYISELSASARRTSGANAKHTSSCESLRFEAKGKAMRGFLVATLFAFAALTPAQSEIRKVDFKNFTYPRTGPLLGHSRLMWLATGVNGKVTLRNGNDGEGFTLQSVT
jgi:hypothetical protein